MDCAVGLTNTQRQENELVAIMKKLNSAGWKLISTSTAIVDSKTSFQIFILTYLVKEIISNTIDFRYLIAVDYISETSYTLIFKKSFL